MQEYLQSTEFLNFDRTEVREYAEQHSANAATAIEKAIALYNRVRDDFQYNPYKLDLRRQGLTASDLLGRNHGYCVEKAVLLAATWRAVGIPSRLSFYKVKNHIGTNRLEQILETNVLVFHGAAEAFLNGEWIKATPAFNRALCEKLGVAPLEFDGTQDSIFQQYTQTGTQFMEYLHDYGAFADLPYDLYLSEINRHYPHIAERVLKNDLVYDLTN